MNTTNFTRKSSNKCLFFIMVLCFVMVPALKTQAQVFSIGGVQAVNQPMCGTATGEVKLQISGGTGYYEYALSEEGTYTALPADRIITGLPAGTHRIWVKDATGTAVSPAITLYNLDTDLAITATTNNASGSGVDDGFIGFTVTGGIAPYEYTLNGIPITPIDGIIERITPGKYVLNVIDDANCTASTGEIILRAADGGLNVSVSDINYTACGNDGSFKLIIGGYNAPYKYQIDGGSVMQTFENEFIIDNLSAGTYTWNITDKNECYAEGSVAIVNYDNFSFNASVTDASCDGTGSTIGLNIYNGEAPYSYSMDNGQTFTPVEGANITIGQRVGTYNIIAKDNRGCTFKYTNAVIGGKSGFTPTLREDAEKSVVSGTELTQQSLSALFVDTDKITYYFYVDAACTIPATLPITTDYSVATTHTYYVQGETKATGCKSPVLQATELIITVTEFATGINTPAATPWIYPNPVEKGGYIVLDLPQWMLEEEGLVIEAYNTNGVLVHKMAVNKAKNELSAENTEGLYFYVARSKSGILKTAKVMVK